MRYIKWIILSDHEKNLPTLGYAIVDDKNYEMQKFQFFPHDQQWEYADTKQHTDRTELADQPLPVNHTNLELQKNPRDWIWEISKTEYQAAFDTHIGRSPT